MSWAEKRKLVYLGSVIVIFFLAVVLPLSIHFYQAPTCFDGKQNGTELGTDCGGSCVLLCPAQYAPLNVLWTRFSKVKDGDYNVLAYIENPNLNAGASNLNYVFKLYDKDGIVLKERSGQTFAPANRVMAVFEPDLLTGNQLPARVSFAFTSEAVWQKQASQETGLSVSEAEITRLDSAPRLSAAITNKTINDIKNIEAIGIIYDTEGNTFAFSRTVLDAVPAKGAETAVFNWPKPFAATPARSEILLKILK